MQLIKYIVDGDDRGYIIEHDNLYLREDGEWSAAKSHAKRFKYPREVLRADSGIDELDKLSKSYNNNELTLNELVNHVWNQGYYSGSIGE